MADNKSENLNPGEFLLLLFGREKQSRPRKSIRAGVAGEGLFLGHVAAALSSLDGIKDILYYHPDEGTAQKNARKLGLERFTADSGEFIAQVEAAEIFELPGGREELAVSLLEADKYVSLQKPFARNAEAAETMIRAEKKSRAFLRVNEYALFYEPYLKLKELLDRMEIGEVCAVRFRSNLCGEGGLGPARELLKVDNGLFHPAFDRAAMATWLLGPVRSVCSYQNTMKARKGGQSIVGFKYVAEGCYGFLDNTFAPGTTIRTDGLSCDDSIEVSGTDGIIWVNHFHGKMTEEPWIEIRRGKKYFSLGIGSDMKLDWKDSIAASAAHFIDCAATGRRPALNSSDALHALRLLLAAAESNAQRKEISI